MMEFKFKLNGQKVKARVLEEGEVINERCMQFLPYYSLADLPITDRQAYLSREGIVEELSNGEYHPSCCVGEKNNEHGHENRIYIEILSSFWKPLSNDDCSEYKE